MPDSLKKKTIKGVVWSSIERFSVQGIQFVIMIIMARILTPYDYGIIGMLTIFLQISQSLIDSGFSQALIRKQNRTETDNSTVFYFNIAISSLLYIILFISAPWVADFYNTPILIPVMRVICLSVLINSFVVVQRALFTVNIDFKTQAKASFIAAVFSGIVGIGMAYGGCGVWSLVVYQLINYAGIAFLLWYFSKWRPIFAYSWKSFKELFSFGSKLLISGLLATIYNNVYLIVIGKLFTATNLGHYTRAHQFSDFPSSNFTGILQRVTYPVLCTIQNDDERLSEVYRKLLKLSAYIIFPLMCGLAAVAHPLVWLLLGKKWEFCSVLLQILCFSMMWYPIHAINLNLLQVKGRSDLFLKLEIVKKMLGIIVLCITIPMGLIAMCYGQIISSILALIINTYYTGKLINVGFIKQMKDISGTLILSLIMFISIILLISTISSLLLELILGLSLGAIIYLGISKLLRFKELNYVLSIINKNR
ncbi:lipopolysaccharide biosynthesis protein [Phocaeicola abscessus]|uniref:lipopolysaccharide biosynthesis protein n=1 Tax=Phocaeicola abscessus TaxID=555313 RepID=UPI0028EF00D2|nr:lipopolysaccharide biosynthesis protein [Phocaeicola abscessus]